MSINSSQYCGMGVTTCPSTDRGDSNLEEENRRLSSKIEIMEKKIRAKDQLLDESLAVSCNRCGESQGLTTKLKKRVLKQKQLIEEAEAEIKRLTKTVKVVEVEVHADTKGLEEELRRLQTDKVQMEKNMAESKQQF